MHSAECQVYRQRGCRLPTDSTEKNAFALFKILGLTWVSQSYQIMLASGLHWRIQCHSKSTKAAYNPDSKGRHWQFWMMCQRTLERLSEIESWPKYEKTLWVSKQGHVRLECRFTHTTSTNILAPQNHHKQHQGLMLLVNTSSLFYLCQKGTCSLEPNVFWCNSRFRNSLCTVYPRRSWLSDECQGISRRSIRVVSLSEFVEEVEGQKTTNFPLSSPLYTSE